MPVGYFTPLNRPHATSLLAEDASENAMRLRTIDRLDQTGASGVRVGGEYAFISPSTLATDVINLAAPLALAAPGGTPVQLATVAWK